MGAVVIDYAGYNIINQQDIIDYNVLLRITEAEATGATMDQKENVVQVILNRIKSSQFPNRASDVVFQKGQFSPISDKRYWRVKITKSTIKAVDEIIESPNKHDGLFFVCPKLAGENNLRWFKNKLTFVVYDGLHEFYK